VVENAITEIDRPKFAKNGHAETEEVCDSDITDMRHAGEAEVD
jgi:hypothetical protein